MKILTVLIAHQLEALFSTMNISSNNQVLTIK